MMNTDKTTKTASVSQKYTLEDVGCYVDGARGVYAINNIAAFAIAHGHSVDRCEEDVRYAGHPFADEIENEIDDFMDKNFAVEGAYWGRNENGDWGLWSSEEALADQTRSQLDRAMEQAGVDAWPKSDPFIAERERDNAKIDAAQVEYDEPSQG